MLHFGGSLKRALKQRCFWAQEPPRVWRELWLRPGSSSSHAAPTSTFITKLLDHYGLRWSFTAFDFFFSCCQTGGKWCVIWSKMLLFVFICCFKIWWLPAITLLWQGPRAPWRQGEPGSCQALWGFEANCGHVHLYQVGTQSWSGPWRSPERGSNKTQKKRWWEMLKDKFLLYQRGWKWLTTVFTLK